MPSGRIRFAELAASMLWAAPLVALLTFPAAAALEIEPAQHPQQVAYLASWACWGHGRPSSPPRPSRADGSTGPAAG